MHVTTLDKPFHLKQIEKSFITVLLKANPEQFCRSVFHNKT